MSAKGSPFKVPLSEPDVTEPEIQAVVDVLRTPELSFGPKLPAFENAIARYVGARHAVATSSGTAALHLCVRGLCLSSGDEVLTTPFSFIASANALIYEGVRPVFVDIDPVSLNIDPERLESAVTPRTRAVLAVHVFGRPSPMDAIGELARRHGLRVIEDACEAIGGEYAGRRLGTLGDAGTFAFYPNKQITTGEGGAVVTDDPDLARMFATLRNQGREPGSVSGHAQLGYNYRLGEMPCALGLAQLGRLEAILARRAVIAQRYDERLAGLECLIRPALQVQHARLSWFVYVVRLVDEVPAGKRDRIAQGLLSSGIGCGQYFSPIHLQPFYREQFGYRPGDFPVTERVAQRTLALPFFNRITDAQIDTVCDTLIDLCG